MIANITYIRLRNPFKFFEFTRLTAMVVGQIKKTNHNDFKARVLGTTSYTMTLWENEETMKEFARSGAHLKAMKASAGIASEAKTLTIEADKLPSWEEALDLLKEVPAVVYR